MVYEVSHIHKGRKCTFLLPLKLEKLPLIQVTNISLNVLKCLCLEKPAIALSFYLFNIPIVTLVFLPY